VQVKLAQPDALTTTPLPAAPLLRGAWTCDRVADRLGDHADGSLPQLERVGLVHHLSDCPACRDAADEYHEVIRLAAALPPIAPPTAARARILAALRAAV
jgi:anti-sigma factor RsiW